MKTHGTARLDRKTRRWVIEVEPHVALRLKRVFGKLSKASHGKHYLSDTIENARDLAWFAERYPIEIDPRDHLEANAKEHRERQALVDDLLAKRREAPAFDLAIPAREYQRVAAAMLLASGGLLLADDVGLGKTISAICALTDPRTLPALIVTLTHLPGQWVREIARFAPKLRVHVLKTGKPYDVSLGPKGARCKGKHRFVANELARGGARCSRCDIDRDDAYHGRENAMPDVLVCNYHKLAGWAETLAPLVRSVVFDECQELRTGDNGDPRRGTPAKYTAAIELARAASFRCGTSATPIYNYGGEFFSVLNVIRPDVLGTRSEFLQEWCSGSYGDRPRIADPKAFGAYVRESGLMLRRTRADVGRELPAIQRIPHHVEADLGALDQVSSSCAELARIILSQGESHRGQKMMASEELSIKLRQATGVAKAPFVADFVRLLVESGEKVVLFGWHRDVYSIWMDRLADLKPALYTGSESPVQKEEARKRFVEGDASVFIMSLRSGAGLDGLQFVCRTAVFGELDWSPGVHEQCAGRVHRDGQKDPVVAYFMIADGGSDPIVADVLGVKKAQIDGLRDPNVELVEKLEVDPNHVRRLAAAYLEQRGLGLPMEAAS